MISQWLSNRIETSKPVTQRYRWSCPHMLFQTHYLIVCDQTEHLTTMSHTSCLVLLLQEATSQSSLPCVLVETIHLEQGWLKGCLFHEVVFISPGRFSHSWAPATLCVSSELVTSAGHTACLHTYLTPCHKLEANEFWESILIILVFSTMHSGNRLVQYSTAFMNIMKTMSLNQKEATAF